MGSMATEDVTSSSNVVLKDEPLLDDELTPSSASSPTADGELEASASAIGAAATELGQADQPPPVPKRKGGRKPIYATSEERKQRNRQAQAAFRERRTEYIKQLETTIQHHEETLQNLQQSHRTAADECLMLRYKNSLLERILLEKGIDVQAELRLKGSPHLRPVRQGSSVTGQASPMQKAMLNRQQQIRQRPVIQPPLQTVNTSPLASAIEESSGLLGLQPTPPSQQSSPSALRSPAFSVAGGLRSPLNDVQMQTHQANLQQPQSTNAHMQRNLYTTNPRSHARNASATAVPQNFGHTARNHHHSSQSMPQNYYASSFQKHYDQLDQEYDAQVEMLDDAEEDDVEPDSYIPNFRLPPNNGNMAMGVQASPPATTSGASDGGGVLTVPFDYDPMLDADPFGLTASMHFPNPFTFPSNGQRR